jgi:hypothetical protein
VLAGIAVFAFARKMGTESTPSTATPVAQKGTAGPPRLGVGVRSDIPDDPPPALAALAHEVPAMEAKLLGDAAYIRVWDPARRSDQLLFLNVVSQVTETQSGGFAHIDDAQSASLKKLKLLDPVLTLTGIASRVGRYPSHFDQNVRALLTEMHPLPHLGLCGTGNALTYAFDISALAAWMMKDRPEYLHALLACRRETALGWPAVSSPNLPYIQTERGALERLAWLGDLTEAERDRLDELRLPELKLPTVDATELWRAYDANEVAADNQWKGKQIIITGEVAGISKDFTDAIIIQLRSPNEFMPTQAYVKETSAPKAATLQKHQKIVLTCTCTGKIMASPVLRDCVIRS